MCILPHLAPSDDTASQCLSPANLHNPGYLWLRATTVDDISVALSQVHCLKLSIEKYGKLKCAGPVQDGCNLDELIYNFAYIAAVWMRLWVCAASVRPDGVRSEGHQNGIKNIQISSRWLQQVLKVPCMSRSAHSQLGDLGATGRHIDSAVRSVGTSGLEPRCQSLGMGCILRGEIISLGLLDMWNQCNQWKSCESALQGSMCKYSRSCWVCSNLKYSEDPACNPPFRSLFGQKSWAMQCKLFVRADLMACFLCPGRYLGD
jgi:hypothetical protein